MSIKFKCKCGHVLSVPEKLAGKSGKCPKCKETVKVPVPKAAKQASAKQPSGASAANAMGGGAMAGMLDGLLDDAGLTQKSGPTCTNCMVSIKPGTVICTNCGLNFETGEKIKGFDVKASGPEFENMYLQEAADNMVRETVMESRRDKAAMPWWVIMSFLIGALTLCAAGVVIVDGKFGTPEPETSFIGKVQRWPVFTTLGLTSLITGVAITVFAHLSITFFGFTRNVWQGLACFFLPLLYSLIYGIMSWTENKAPVKAIMMALVFIGLGVFLIMRAGGFGLITSAF